jgi:DNA sulfur modification protein DndE
MMAIEQIRLSQAAKDQLLRLKRRTGIKNWNVLCRWGLCRSIAEATPPSPIAVPADSSVEMSWKTFGGIHADLYWALLRWRCYQDGLPLDEDTLQQQFRLHLHRGIAYLAGDKKLQQIEDLIIRGGSTNGNPLPEVLDREEEASDPASGEEFETVT